MSLPRIGIRGIGLATALGPDASHTWLALLEGSAITDHAPAALPTSGRLRARQLAIKVAIEAMENAGWTADATMNSAAILVGTSKGSIVEWITPLLHMSDMPYVAGGLTMAGLSDVAAAVAQVAGSTLGPRLTFSAACASGLHALIHGVCLLQSGRVDRALVVAVEASLHPLFLATFRRLGVLAPVGHVCRPFDRNRSGFLVSEAAAAVCLERIPARPVDWPAVEGFCLAGDAAHITNVDPMGRALTRAIRESLAGRSADLVHAHGTGTESHDAVELAAIESALGDDLPPPALYSHKAAIGHSLGAAGLVAVALNCLMHREGWVPGNIHTTQPMTMKSVYLASGPQCRRISRSLAIAAGFGGSIAAVTLTSR